MHLGKSYKVSEFVVWTRRRIYLLLAMAAVPVVLYTVCGLRWMTMPLAMVGLLGTATSFIVGFKNVQTYNRTIDAQQLWTAILGSSRFWGTSVQNCGLGPAQARELIARHLAWLNCLRYELRTPRPWETAEKASHAEYRRTRYRIPEHETPLDEALRGQLPPAELRLVLDAEDKALQVLWLQGQRLKQLLDEGHLSLTYHVELHKLLKEFIGQQGHAERIKNYPYPRQYAIINTIFVWAFCTLLPFGLLQEFDKLNHGVSGFMQGHMVWLVVPFSATISWMYTALDQVGESTENPFEGGANDVPISYVARRVERELLAQSGALSLPTLPRPVNDILM